MYDIAWSKGGRNSRGFAIEGCGSVTLYLAWARDLVRTTAVAGEPSRVSAIGTGVCFC